MSFETPPRPRWLLRVSLAVGTVLVLVLGIVVVVDFMYRCDTDVWYGEDGECVGVTDGSFPYSDDLADVSEKIRKENENAEQNAPYVTVAVLMPMTAEAGDSLSTSQIREYLQGAHVAQHAANRDPNGLKVRLALANEGRYERDWEQVTEQLLGMVDVPSEGVDATENLVAVTGLGLSNSETVDGARRMSDAGIPLIGYLSANGFNNTTNVFNPPMSTLNRVSPSLDQELAAVAGHLAEEGGKPSKAILVKDNNPNDYYTADLHTGFKKHFYQAWKNGNENYTRYTGGPDQYNLNIHFQGIADRLCHDDLNTVLYAGRTNLLRDFVDNIRNRSCAPDREITVVTGSEATDLRLEPNEGTAPVSVLYASASDPTALSDQSNQFLNNYRNFQEQLRKRFPAGARESNWTVMGHDATKTATTAAQKSVGQNRTVPTTSQVRDRLGLINEPRNVVDGASGEFYINADGDRVSGPIPVLRTDGSGEKKVQDLGGLSQ